ncbi:MAG: hypothetical protein H0U81_11985 [Pyrinomonadaceae bacterium]|nr:hypothetical protein [Pyrinomonadaceae bacterium]
MKLTLAVLILALATTTSAYGQGKGVDQQSDRIRDGSTNRAPAVNGGKVNTGTGRGIDFGRGRTPELAAIPNPYRLTARRDAVTQAVEELMRERKLILDESVSKPLDGVLVTQPYTFIRGAVVTESELGRLAEVPETNSRGWTRGRYTLLIEIQPIDGTYTNVAVNARVEGRTDGATGAEWVTLRSSGTAEEDFLGALIEKITGGPPLSNEP